MNKKVFIVESDGYSIELLNFYMERELGVKVNNFFNFDEVLMYLKLEPSIILYDKNNTSLEESHIQVLCDKLPQMPEILALDNDRIVCEKIDDSGNLVEIDEFRVNNIYFSIIDTCYNLLNIEVQNI